MRATAVLLLVACSKGPFHVPDAAQSDAPKTSDARNADASPDATAMCTGLVQIPFDVSRIDGVASDGTTLYASVVTRAGAIELQAIPLTGIGAPTTIATASADSFHLTSFGNSVFYAVENNGLYDLHELSGGTNAPLGSVSSTVPPQLAANATDLYILGTGATTVNLSRAPLSGTGPVLVTSVDESNPSLGERLVVGTNVAAWVSQGIRYTSIPATAPVSSAAVPNSGFVSGLALHNDTGYALSVGLVTSNTSEQRIDEFTPSTALIWREDVSSTSTGKAGNLFGDANRLYFTKGDLRWLAFDGMSGSEICNFDPGIHGQQDATHIFGIVNGATPVVNVIAKP